MARTIEYAPVEEVEFQYGGKSYAIVEPTLADLKPYKEFISKNAIQEGGKVVGVRNPSELEPLVLVACVREVHTETKERKRCKAEAYNEFPRTLLTSVIAECNRMIGAGATPEEVAKEEEQRGNE